MNQNIPFWKLKTSTLGGYKVGPWNLPQYPLPTQFSNLRNVPNRKPPLTVQIGYIGHFQSCLTGWKVSMIRLLPPFTKTITARTTLLLRHRLPLCPVYLQPTWSAASAAVPSLSAPASASGYFPGISSEYLLDGLACWVTGSLDDLRTPRVKVVKRFIWMK